MVNYQFANFSRVKMLIFLVTSYPLNLMLCVSHNVWSLLPVCVCVPHSQQNPNFSPFCTHSWPSYGCIPGVSYTTTVVYSRDHKGVGVAHEITSPKKSLNFPR